MQTNIPEQIKHTRSGIMADEILRKCVHCGFCSATCPTYQVLADERDSPRGRIYLIKTLLEGEVDTKTAQRHLDRCLTCRACETTCPSGVEYGRLLEIGRGYLAHKESHLTTYQLAYRYCLRKLITSKILLSVSLLAGRFLKPFLPKNLQAKLPEKQLTSSKFMKRAHSKKVILVQGCVQSAVTPKTNNIAATVLDKLGVESLIVKNEQCCGALSHHLSATDEAKNFIRKNIDIWWPLVDEGIEAIISTASGCGVMLKDYAYLMAEEPEYAEKAKKISTLVVDIAEYLQGLDISSIQIPHAIQGKCIVFHSPCTLQHGQKLNGKVEGLFNQLGLEFQAYPDAHLCCGSAGAYSLLQADLSGQLLEKKISAINSVKPDLIVTANIGCQLQLQEASNVPVMHWIELLEEIQ